MVDLGVIAVAAAPTQLSRTLTTVTVPSAAARMGAPSLSTGNVGAGVGTAFASNGVNTVAKLRGNCSCNRKRPLQSACWGAGAVRGHKFTTALGKATGQFPPIVPRTVGLTGVAGRCLSGGEMIICRHLIGCFVGQFDYGDSFGYLCCDWIAVLVGSVYGSHLRVGGMIHRVHCPHGFPQPVHRYKMENPKTNSITTFLSNWYLSLFFSIL